MKKRVFVLIIFFPFACMSINQEKKPSTSCMSINQEKKPSTSPMKKTLSESSLGAVSFSSDGKTLALGGGDFRGPGELFVFDVASGKKLAHRKDHARAIWSVHFSPDGRFLATGGGVGQIMIYDAHNYNLVKKLEVDANYTFGLSFSPDGKKLAAVGTGGFVAVWEIPTFEKNFFRESVSKGRCIHNLTFSKDGTILIVPGREEVQFFNPRTGAEIKRWKFDQCTMCTALHEERLAVAFCDSQATGDPVLTSMGWVRVLFPGVIKVMDLHSGQVKTVCKGHSNSILRLSFHPSGKTIISGSTDNTIRIWDAENGLMKQCFNGHKTPVRSIAVSRDGKFLASVSDDSILKLWDFDRNKEIPVCFE